VPYARIDELGGASERLMIIERESIATGAPSILSRRYGALVDNCPGDVVQLSLK
jgi:hypothetical protein